MESFEIAKPINAQNFGYAMAWQQCINKDEPTLTNLLAFKNQKKVRNPQLCWVFTNIFFQSCYC